MPDGPPRRLTWRFVQSRKEHTVRTIFILALLI